MMSLPFPLTNQVLTIILVFREFMSNLAHFTVIHHSFLNLVPACGCVCHFQTRHGCNVSSSHLPTLCPEPLETNEGFAICRRRFLPYSWSRGWIICLFPLLPLLTGLRDVHAVSLQWVCGVWRPLCGDITGLLGRRWEVFLPGDVCSHICRPCGTFSWCPS